MVIVVIASGNGNARCQISVLGDTQEAERYIEGLLREGIPPTQIRAFRARELSLPPLAVMPSESSREPEAVPLA